ncbi:hypothetical protein ACFWOX_24060 [Streptomyces sp. NPDC058467]|uniref:hypothetical protein n=1 Tax=Streptomyces sp. NPDC058467 TaxID=3346513 RepID=UPI0036493F4A
MAGVSGVSWAAGKVPEAIATWSIAFIAAHRRRALVLGELVSGVDRERCEGDRREDDGAASRARV